MRVLSTILFLAACGKPAPAPSVPAAATTLLTAVGDSATIIESVALYGGKLCGIL